MPSPRGRQAGRQTGADQELCCGPRPGRSLLDARGTSLGVDAALALGWGKRQVVRMEAPVRLNFPERTQRIILTIKQYLYAALQASNKSLGCLKKRARFPKAKPDSESARVLSRSASPFLGRSCPLHALRDTRSSSAALPLRAQADAEPKRSGCASGEMPLPQLFQGAQGYAQEHSRQARKSAGRLRGRLTWVTVSAEAEMIPHRKAAACTASSSSSSADGRAIFAPRQGRAGLPGCPRPGAPWEGGGPASRTWGDPALREAELRKASCCRGSLPQRKRAQSRSGASRLQRSLPQVLPLVQQRVLAIKPGRGFYLTTES